MKILLTTFVIISLNFLTILGQEKNLQSGEIVFHAVENRDFTATSNAIKSTLNFTTNSVSIEVPINRLRFKNKEDYNQFLQKENLNQATYPNFIFNFEIYSNEALTKEGRHIVSLKGEITIKGITHKYETNGLLINKSGKTTLETSFLLDGKQYGLNSESYKDFVDQLEFSVELVY